MPHRLKAAQVPYSRTPPDSAVSAITYGSQRQEGPPAGGSPGVKLRLRPPYLLVAASVLLTEVLIATFVHDRWVRPFGGDLLVVVLLHFLARGLLPLSQRGAALGAFAFACLVEIGQWLQLAQRLGLEHHWFGRLFLGTTFHWGDVLAYALGACCAWWADSKVRVQQVSPLRA